MPLPPTVSNAISKTTPARLEVAKYVRNGLLPHASFESDLAYAANFTAAVRSQEFFRWRCPLASIPASNGTTDRIRWRFAAHTGPAASHIRCLFLMARQSVGDPVYSPKATLTITDATESTTYGSCTFHFGSSNAPVSPPSDYPSEFGWGEVSIAGIPANTAIYGKLTDDDAGRLVAVSVCERALSVTAANGYIMPQGVAAKGPIYDSRRLAMYELGRDIWRQGPAHLFNWTVDDQTSPRTTTSTTAVNILDNAAVTAVSPGWKLDMSYCGTRARPSAIPCVFAARAKMSGGTGRIKLKDASGTTLATLTPNTTSEAWYTTAVNLDSNDQTYFVTYEADATRTTSLYAVSLYQNG